MDMTQYANDGGIAPTEGPDSPPESPSVRLSYLDNVMERCLQDYKPERLGKDEE